MRALVVAWFASALCAQTTARVRVDTVVRGADGKPVADVEFADRWTSERGRWLGSLSCSPPDQKAPLRSAGDGTLRGTWMLDPFETSLLAWSKDRDQVAVVVPEVDAQHDYVVVAPIVLQPAVSLRVEVVAAGAAKTFAVSVSPADSAVGRLNGFVGDDAWFALPLPAGQYELVALAGYGRSTPRTVVLPPDRREVDVGTVHVAPKPFDLLGEVLPDWAIGGVDNLPAERATLAALRGRPLLVVFDQWGRRWQPAPALRDGVAALARHPHRGEFAVVLFDTSMAIRGGGVDPPPDEPAVERALPVLRPPAGWDAAEHYGANWAIAVLDRDGRLVACERDLDTAVRALERMLPTPAAAPAAVELFVLGVAQDGGLPHVGCERACCAEARARGRSEAPACLGVVDRRGAGAPKLLLVEATPAVERQLARFHALAGVGGRGRRPVDAVLVTHAHIGHYLGLAHFGREVAATDALPVWCSPRFAGYVRQNGPWRQLVELGQIAVREFAVGEPFEPWPGIQVTPIAVPHRDEFSDTMAFVLAGPNRRVLFVPDVDAWDKAPGLLDRLLAGVDTAYLDGTFFDGSELPERDPDEIPHPLIVRTMARLADVARERPGAIRFIHLNHTNPALVDPAVRARIAAAGFAVAVAGERLAL